MRIRVDGDCESATALRSLLKKGGHTLGNIGVPGTLYTVTLEDGDVPCPVVDGVDCEMERRIVNAIAELTPSGKVLLQRSGGVQSQYAIRVVVPNRDDERGKVELGIFRGLAHVVPNGKPAPKPRVTEAAKALLMFLGIR